MIGDPQRLIYKGHGRYQGCELMAGLRNDKWPRERMMNDEDRWMKEARSNHKLYKANERGQVI